MATKPTKTTANKPSAQRQSKAIPQKLQDPDDDQRNEFVHLVSKMNVCQVIAFTELMKNYRNPCQAKRSEVLANLLRANPKLTEEDRAEISRLAGELFERSRRH